MNPLQNFSKEEVAVVSRDCLICPQKEKGTMGKSRSGGILWTPLPLLVRKKMPRAQNWPSFAKNEWYSQRE